MDICRAWFRKKGGLGRCSAELPTRKCSSLPASARQFNFTSNTCSTSTSSSSETPTQETPPTPRATPQTKKEQLTRRERRELLKARVEALRSRLRDSSSDEEDEARKTPTNADGKTLHNKFHCDQTLHKDARVKRGERFLRRSRNPSRRTPEMRTCSLERAPVVVVATRKAPTPPPRSPSKLGDHVIGAYLQHQQPPPPPVRHGSRPVSFAFENGFVYEGLHRCNVEQGPRTRTNPEPIYTNNNKNAPPKTIPPAVPPRRGSLQVSSPPHNLEDALLELERIYKSLKLSDDAILDRADRHMLNFDAVMPPAGNFRTLSRSSVSGSYDSLVGSRMTDDLAYRRFSRPTTRSNTPGVTGSYLLVSPHLSPGTSTEDLFRKLPPRRSLSREPDTIRDDVTFRAMRDANNRHPHQPEGLPFGIPTGVAVPTNATDYLRPGGVAKQRPTFRPRFTPDVVQDDMALRNLRKDVNSQPKSSAVNTDELDAILRNGKDVKPPNSGAARRKYRAVKSLSANISHLVQKRQPGLFFDEAERTQSMTDIMAAIASDGGFYSRPKESFSAPPVPPLPSRHALKNGNSTDTLTETDHEIWQLRVSHGPLSQQVVKRDGWRSDTEGRNRVRPLDEGSLDELLNSLAMDTDTEVRKKLQQGKDSRVGKVFKPGLKSSEGEKAMGSTQSCTGKQESSSKVLLTQTDESESRGSRTTGAGDGHKAERMAKYKEERRRQLASKYGDWSSSEDITSLGEEPSYMRLSNRYRRQKTDSRTQNTKNQIPDPGGTSPSTPESGLVRSNRASRLRAMAAGVGVQENGANNSEFVRVGSLRAKLTQEEGFQRGSVNRRSFSGSSYTPEWNGKTTSSQTTSSSEYGDNFESPFKLKDKSLKRKSNLNRTMLVESSSQGSSSTNDSLQMWRRAKKSDSPRETTVMSEGSSFRIPSDLALQRKINRPVTLKRPEIPEILRHSRLNHPNETINNNDDEEIDTDVPEIYSPSSFTVKFHVTETCLSPAEDGSGDAVGRVHELTQLVRETTEKVDTLTTAALHSDLISDLETPQPFATSPHVTKTANGSSIVNITAKPPPSTPVQYQPFHVSRIRIKGAEVADAQVCQMEANGDDETNSKAVSDQEEVYVTPVIGSPLKSRDKMPSSILKKNSIDEGKSTDEEPASILRKKLSVDEGKTQSILKSGNHESEEVHHGILKRRSSVEGGEPKPILKKRSSIEESDRLRPILKAQRTTDEESEGRMSAEEMENEIKPILKRQQRIEEVPAGILKNSVGAETPPVARRSSIVKRSEEEVADVEQKRRSSIVKRSEEEVADVEQKRDEERSESGPPLLPSILKKRSKDVHPLATPFTEFQNIIRARNPQEETQPKPPVPIDLAEGGEMSGERRMSVAERIFQMETRMADDATKKSSGYSTPRGTCNSLQGTVVTEHQIETRLEQFSSVTRVSRRTSPRYRTQPITMEEVGESKNVTNVEKLKQAFLTRINGFHEKDDDPSPPPPKFSSPQLRKKLFVPVEQHANTDDERPRPFLGGHALQRSRTQPVTLNEMKNLDEIDGKTKEKTSSDSEEDPCKMSLAERVKLFDQKVVEERFSALRKNQAPLDLKNSRRTSPRFKTQPITWAEMEFAANENNNNSKDGNDEEPSSLPVNNNSCSHEFIDAEEQLVEHSPPKVHPPASIGRATIVVSSSNDEDSSGPYSSRRIIKNEAINRRRNAALRRKDERRSMCELYDSIGTESSSVCEELAIQERSVLRNHQRSTTVPTTKLELDSVDKVSIADRLAALRKSGEENWKERLVGKDEVEISKVENGELPKKKTLAEIREGRRDRSDRPSSIVDRISKLEIAQEGWKQRVEEKDSVQFTVAGRMGCPEVEIPTLTRSVPKPTVFKSETMDFRALHQEREKLNSSSPVQRSATVPACNLLVDKKENSKNEFEVPSRSVVVPKADDESFHAFFESVSCDKMQHNVEISEDGFQEVMSASRQMLVQKREVVRQRRTAASSRNPVKTLASRTDIQNEYTEVKTGIVEKEFKRVKTEQIAQNTTSLAVSALAGLASKEDFTAISLRKGASTISGPLLPFKDFMLLQVKGRRHVQTRLVKPCVQSMNRGDNYIVVTPREVFNWIGKFSNVIEKAKGADVLSTIQQKRDLGLAANAQVIIVDEEKNGGSCDEKRCFELLNGDASQLGEAGNPKEDEVYESAIVDTNMVYEVEDDRLVPHSKCWGSLPKIEILDSRKVLVFDFGSEMYVWQGKLAPTPLRRVGVHLAQQLWDQGYNYSECVLNPLNPTLLESNEEPKKGMQRPPWALFGKINQHMETILFKEKFVDWPDTQRIIKVKGKDKEKEKTESPELVPYDAKEMVERMITEPDLILEGSHLGRGKSYYDSDSRRHYEITTLGIKVWHVREKTYKMLPRESWGQFHSGDTYVVRWQYMVTVTGRNLSGQMSRHSFVGRERCAYFFWQGSDSTVNDKGASALMTVELDEERGPHVRVDEGHEPPSFLSLFDGSMIIHKGKRKLLVDDEDNSAPISNWKRHAEVRLFIIRSQVESEACLVEVETRRSSLRSRGSLILVDARDGTVFAWHGAKTQPQTRQVALCTAEIITDRRPLEFGFECNALVELNEVDEGSESVEFFQKLQGDGKFFTLQSSLQSYDFTPRLFHLSSVSGSFVATEVQCAFRSSSLSVPFPFLQCDLYSYDQPALFVLDNEHEIFVWQGWWPEASDDNDNVATGSAKVRWNMDRRLAMETAIKYCNEKNKEEPPNAYLVSAGLEPLRFTNIFPKWEVREDVALLNSQDGKKPNDCPLVSEVLPHISRSRYSLTELQTPQLPEGVDPSRIESYLNDSDFEEALGMSPTEFYVLPAWKQNEMKKLSCLF